MAPMPANSKFFSKLSAPDIVNRGAFAGPMDRLSLFLPRQVDP